LNARESASAACPSAGVNRLIAELFEAEIGARIKVHNIHPLFHHGNERQEQRAIESVLVKKIGPDVGGCYDNRAPFEKSGKKSAKYHCIRNVGHAELIKAKQPRVLGNRLSRRCNWIIPLDEPIAQFSAPFVNKGMN
jgi:hypothetical protein